MDSREAQAVIDALAAALVWAQDEATELQADAEKTHDRLAAEIGRSNKLSAERDEARRKLEAEVVHSDAMAVERNEAQKQLAQANGHNDLLHDQNAQLQAALKARMKPYPDIEAEIRAEMRGDQAEPDLAAALNQDTD